eukprot:2598987-Rhodomonas_salina.1
MAVSHGNSLAVQLEGSDIGVASVSESHWQCHWHTRRHGARRRPRRQPESTQGELEACLRVKLKLHSVKLGSAGVPRPG